MPAFGPEAAHRAGSDVEAPFFIGRDVDDPTVLALVWWWDSP